MAKFKILVAIEVDIGDEFEDARDIANNYAKMAETHTSICAEKSEVISIERIESDGSLYAINHKKSTYEIYIKDANGSIKKFTTLNAMSKVDAMRTAYTIGARNIYSIERI